MEAELIYNVQVLISGAQKSDFFIYICIYICIYVCIYIFFYRYIFFFRFFFHYRLLQDNEYSFLSQPTFLKFVFNF